MKRRFFPQRLGSTAESTAENRAKVVCGHFAGVCALAALLGAVTGASQVITIDTSGKGNVAATGPVDRRYAQIEPTHVALDKTELDPKTRIELIRALESEQGFAMRPFPRGHKGLTLVANGKLEPAGESYLNMVISEGLSAKPGARLVITDIKIDRSKIVFDLDGGPDAKHRFLRHIQISAGPEMGDPNIDPTVANAAGDPVGSRLTLTFADHVPEITPAQVKALLAPLISFDVKSPVQAFTDTLPPELKNAILGHKVLVGMTTDMVLFAMGQPTTKTREMDGQMPFEEWIYGTPPQEVNFVRINGNRVIRLEVARDGEPLQIFTKDVVSAMMTTDGKPVITAQANTRTVREGDVETDTNKQAPAAPPSLRKPGESLPTDNTSVGVMRPVQFPKPHTDQQPGANPDEQPSTPAATGQPAQGSYPQPAAQGNAQSPPANSSQPQAAPAKTPAPPTGGQQPPASTSQLVTSGTAAQPN
ncbi:MAG TPA: hypothetical protein VJX73_10770 [Terracidiphilus sp.]|nr:hypothetical protein [Terracidiphilus sp.]